MGATFHADLASGIADEQLGSLSERLHGGCDDLASRLVNLDGRRTAPGARHTVKLLGA